MTRPSLAALRSFPLAFAAVLAIVAPGCKPKPGEKCSEEGKSVCLEKASALACVSGKWEVMACRGTTGCMGVANQPASCDNMYSEPQDVCLLEDDYACTADKKAFLQCRGKKWQLAGACRGQRGCQVNTKNVKCDASIAKLDDPCMKDDEGDHACSEDKASTLVCRGGKFILAGKCGGPKGCRVVGEDIDCDDSAADLGDPCPKDEHYTCSKDAKLLLVCKAGKFVKEEECRKRTTCRVIGDKVGCK